MTPKQRLKALKDTLNKVLPGFLKLDAGILLWQFIEGFTLLKKRKEAKGFKKVWYTIIAVPLFIDGFIRDVRVNATSGEYMFGKYSKGAWFYAGQSTLTGTLIRVVQAGPKATNFKLAVQIAEVLNDYDPGHVNLEGVKV